MNRRTFVSRLACSAALGALAPRLWAAAGHTPQRFGRAMLTDAEGAPLRPEALKPRTDYLFFYPFAGTPCFLIDLGQSVEGRTLSGGGGSYTWPGGVGPGRSIVAYSAICAHQLSRPSPKESVINYRPDLSDKEYGAGLISCCAHNSAYDPAGGGCVASGPAERPLTAILLEHDAASEGLAAVGILGADVYADFFKAYKIELKHEFGPGVAREPVGDRTRVVPFTDYVKVRATC